MRSHRSRDGGGGGDDETALERSDCPPEPPPLAPRIRLPPLQRIGIPILLAVPVLALAGVFDGRDALHRRTLGALEVEIEAPERVRQNRPAHLHVDVENRGDRPVDAEIAVTPAYVEGASAVQMTPQPFRAWATRLEHIPPGARHRVALDWDAETAGRHRGVVRVTTSEGEEMQARLDTVVLP